MTEVKPVAWVEYAENGNVRMWNGDLSAWANRHANPEPLYPQSAIDALRDEVEGLRAARMAYASEFPLNADGEPDVGSIHQNIRALRAEAEGLKGAIITATYHLAGIGYPEDKAGLYAKDGEWTFSEAVPNSVNEAEVRTAFRVLKVALARAKEAQP